MEKLHESQCDIIHFKLIIKDLLISIKNATLYDTDHPIFIISLKKFKTNLDTWLNQQTHFEFSVSSHFLIVDQEILNTGEQYLSEMADLVHNKGILSVKIVRNVQLLELVHFVEFIKIERRFKDNYEDNETRYLLFPNIQIKEIDFSDLLSGKYYDGNSEEEKIWSFIYNAEDKPELLNNIMDSLIQFIKETNSSASFLNKIYREAVRKQSDDKVSDSIRQVLFKLCGYFKNSGDSEGYHEFKADMLGLLSKLHPDLLVNLFQETQIEGQNYDLSRQIIQDFSDLDVAQFLESLIREEGSINEHLVRIFQKIIPDSSSADRITPLVADQILGQQLNSIQQIQLSIKELFKDHPDNCFLNEMYKITVEVFSESDQQKLRHTIKLGPVINQFVKSFDEEGFRKEHSWIYLKLLDKEDNFIEYKKYAEVLYALFLDLLNHKEISTIKNLYAYHQHILRRAVHDPPELLTEKRAFNNLICSEEIIQRIIHLIPEADQVGISDIANILILNKQKSNNLLLQTYLSEKKPSNRKKLVHVIGQMKGVMGEAVIRLMDQSKPHIIRELFNVLRVCDPDRINMMARKMLNNQDTHVIWEALSNFVPCSEADQEQIFKIIKTHKNPEIRRKAANSLLKTNNKETIQMLFQFLLKKKARKKYLVEVLKNCGEMSIPNAFEPLIYIYLKRILFLNKNFDKFRLIALRSMVQIDLHKTQEFVKGLSGSRNKMFREYHEGAYLKWVCE